MDELIKEAKKGDPDAFTRLMQLQTQSLYKTARALLNNDEDVADARYKCYRYKSRAFTYLN